METWPISIITQLEATLAKARTTLTLSQSQLEPVLNLNSLTFLSPHFLHFYQFIIDVHCMCTGSTCVYVYIKYKI